MMLRTKISILFMAVFLCAGAVHSQDINTHLPSSPIEITTSGLPFGYKGDGYSTHLAATGGETVPYFIGPSLPKGLSLSPDGHLTGTLKMNPGTHTFLVTAVDPDHPDNYEDQTLSLTVYESPRMDKIIPAPAMKGQAYFQAMTFTFGSPYCILSVTGLPPGLSMDTSGRISGIPETGAGTFDFHVTVTDPGFSRHTHTRRFRLTVYDLLAVDTEFIPPVKVNTSLALKLTASGGSGKVLFQSPDLPFGLTLDESGRIFGSPALSRGTYPFTVTAIEQTMPVTVSKPLTLTMVDFFPDDFEPNDGDFTTTNTLEPKGPGQTHTFHTMGDQDVVRLNLSAMEPSHVLHIKTRARARKTRTVVSVYDETRALVVSDKDKLEPMSDLYVDMAGRKTLFLYITEEQGQTGDYHLMVNDAGRKLSIQTPALPDALAKGAYSFQLTAVDGSNDYSFSGKSLPPGLAMDPGGLIHGELSLEPGVYNLTLTVTDNRFTGMSQTRSMPLKVVEFFPDTFDIAGDENEMTVNTLIPGDEAQYHTFHEKGDVDWIRLDLTKASPQDVIVIGLAWPDRKTHTVCTLKDTQGHTLDLVDKGSVQVFSLTDPCELLLCVREQDGKTGEYTLSLNNSGQPLSLITESLAFSESAHDYTQSINTRGGCGSCTYKIVHGVLPAGITLDENTGLLSGKNTVWGDFGFTILAMDRRFPVNATQKSYTLTAYMGEKLNGEDRFEFPHYLSGSFSLAPEHTRTQAFPGDIKGGTPGNLRYRITGHTIPDKGFSHTFDPITGMLTLTGLTPVSCNQYTDTRIGVTVEVRDHLYPNNTMLFYYDISAECLDY